MTIGLAVELRALEFGTTLAGPGLTEPAADSHSLRVAVFERRAMSAPVSRLPASSLSTPAYSVHGNTRCPDGASSH